MPRMIFFLLLAAAAGLVSCVTAPQRPVQTAELFDSTAKSPADIEPETAALPFLAPVAPDTRGAAAAASAAVMARPGRVYEVSIPIVHAAPRSRLEPRVTPLSLPNAPRAALPAASEPRKLSAAPPQVEKQAAPSPAKAAAQAPAPRQAPAPLPAVADAAPVGAPLDSIWSSHS